MLIIYHARFFLTRSHMGKLLGLASARGYLLVLIINI